MRYDDSFGQLTGQAKAVRMENNTFIPNTATINKQLKDNMHVWIILQEDFEALNLDKKNRGKQSRRKGRK